MRTALLSVLTFAVFAFASAAIANQTVWKWVDANGVTHYSDRPVPGAVRMELNVGRSASGSSPAAVSTTSSPSAPSASSTADASPAIPYRNFEIWSPADGETIPNTGGAVTVNVRMDPNLQPGHQLHLYLDGKLVEDFAADITRFDLTEVPRGVHSVIAIITDASGKRLQQSAQVVFTVRQTSIAQPPVGPALRPPPKPRTGAGNKLPASQPSYASLNGERPAIDARTNAPVKKSALKRTD
ncbi:DUF4124 domain-containing protein [Steroidobacter denitrificans]|uniref:DUF4124 domain-containing protein n=1 Tax=Steroidobacter denitrificans TaxID=465721 RepID=UPI00082D43EC|nr:DUF4124 domain-containing protein [Steroidobacter denitrificans]